MLINNANNINFGSVWRVRQSKFTKSQNRVADDIEFKLGKYSKKKDFVIEPLDNDVVELSEVACIKSYENYIEYVNPKAIGKYNEKQPFEIEDYKKIKDNRDSNLLAMCLFTGLYFAGFIFLAIPADRAEVERQAKKVVATTMDSLQKVTKDTLQLTKDTLRMFK